MSRPTREGTSVVSTLVDRRPILKAMLNPKAVGLIGATEAPESVGHSVLKNLHSFGGIVYLINENRSSVPGLESFPSIQEVESIGIARSFLSAAREVALRKPIIVMKVGRTEASAKVLAFHTGTVAGNDDVLAAAFRRERLE